MAIAIRLGSLALLFSCFAGCDSSETNDGGGPPGSTGSGAGSTGSGTASSGAGSTTSSSSTTGSGAGGGAPAGNAADWILEHFADAPVISGDFTERTQVETPALIHQATGCCAKYAFDMIEERMPDDRQVGIVDVVITDLVSSDAFGGGISSGYAPGLVLYLDNVQIQPDWPMWESYQTTNYDGMVLDDSAAIYAEDLTIQDWNADGAIDNKAPISQFVRLTISGQGNRGIRYWGAGPHYLVDSHLENLGGAGEGTVMWFSDCGTVVLNVYASTFNGEDTLMRGMFSCDNGTTPTVNYLTTDPRTTGEMHEMFSP